MVQKTRAGEYHEAESKEATAQPVEQNYRQDSRRTEGPKPGYELEGNPGDNFDHDEVSRRLGSFVFLNRSARGVCRRSGSTPSRRGFTYTASSGLADNSIIFCRASTKGLEFGLRTGTEVFKTGFYKGTFRAQTGMIVHYRNFLALFRPY